jgi:hypothetical protein
MRDLQKPEYRRKQEKAAKERQEAEKHEDNVKIIAAMNRVADEQHTENDENSPKEKGKRCRDWITIIGIYFAATVALIAVLVTHKDSSDQVGALSGQLKVMQGQLDAMEADQRPWIGIDRIDDVIQPGAKLYVNVIWKNVGRGPALTARSFVRLKSTRKEEPAPVIPVLKDNNGEPGMLLPGGVNPSPFSDNPLVNQASFDAINNGDLVLWVTGRVDYLDPSGNPHYTAFLAQYSPISRIWEFIRSEAK